MRAAAIYLSIPDGEKASFKKIKAGMSTEEVINILGHPDTAYYFFDSSLMYEFFIKDQSGLRSDVPFVEFDKSRHVIGFSYSKET